MRLSNLYGRAPLRIGSARTAVVCPDGRERPGSAQPLTFAGARALQVPPGATMVSDPIERPLAALSRLAIVLHVDSAPGPATAHPVGLFPTEISPRGAFVDRPFVVADTTPMRCFLASVEVLGAARTLAVIGDSLSDGVGSSPGLDRRWPDVLAERLASRAGAPWAVANQGIGGNRLLNDGVGAGVNALARLDRDVLALPGVAALIVFQGVNDLGFAYGGMTGDFAAAMSPPGAIMADPALVVAAYRQIVDRARGAGLAVYGATLLPFKGSMFWSARAEEARQAINAFIRHGGLFDAVLDFDAALRDPADPQSLLARFHCGDFLHGSDEGYRVLGESVDLALFAA
ncbi:MULTISPECIES: SGNH/GDSL hydrolase family protein [Caulobacter]|uniref:SGNH/GDSL hydrolase family protein n=1 Tax=Caulobacter TaxID=75 RepID=UPI0014030601|nr:SGNH/GDSL hydrolase family protein [Caulobacter radicis]